MSNGFILTELLLTGENKPPAFVNFEPGLNVISGPSETGKTFIFQCINYMLGASTPPKNINESRNYSHCILKLQSGPHEYSLKSDLRGGDFELHLNNIDKSKLDIRQGNLRRRHDESKGDSLSGFLLSLCNLNNKKLKISAIGKKRSLSYRDLAKYLMIEETRITTDKSPILSGQYTTVTAEKSCFKLILTGNDDSELVEKMSDKDISNRKGKLEMLNELIVNIDSEISSLPIEYEPDRLFKIEHSIIEVNDDLKTLDLIYQQLNEKRNQIQTFYSNEREALTDLTISLSRSKVLLEQYSSDEERLLSTIETCILLSSNNESKKECPICHNIINSELSEDNINEIRESCIVESRKIELLKKDLDASQRIMESELTNVEYNIGKLAQDLKNIEIEIRDKIQNKIEASLANLANLEGLKSLLNKYNSFQDRRKSLVATQETIAASIINKKKNRFGGENLSSIIFPLTEQISEILAACNYPDLKSVSFNENKTDFIISGLDRELSGKGYRAITYASFIVGLQKVIQNSNYSIGVPVLDSPLVTYRKPNAEGQEISVDLAMDFYRYLASNTPNQIIIMENEEPPIDIAPVINHIVFTKSISNGRYGFIPISS